MFFHHGLRVPEVCGRIKGLLWQGHLPQMTIIVTRKKVHQHLTHFWCSSYMIYQTTKTILKRYLVSQKFPDCTESFQTDLIMNQ